MVDSRLGALHTAPWQIIEATAERMRHGWTADVTTVHDGHIIVRASGSGPSASAASVRAAIDALAQADPFGPTIWVAQEDRHIVGHAFERNGVIASVGGSDVTHGRLLRLLAITPIGFVRFATATAGYLAIRTMDRGLAVQIEPSAHRWRQASHWAHRVTRASTRTEKRGRSVACTF